MDHTVIKSFVICLCLLVCIITSAISRKTSVIEYFNERAKIVANNPILRYFYEIELHKDYICNAIEEMDSRARAIIYHTHHKEYNDVHRLQNMQINTMANIHRYLLKCTADVAYCRTQVNAFIQNMEHRFATTTDRSFKYDQKALDVEKAALIDELTRIMMACPMYNPTTVDSQEYAKLLYNMPEIASHGIFQRAYDEVVKNSQQ